MGKPIQKYTSFFEHLMTLFKKIGTGEIFEIKFPLQTLHSSTCDLHCLHMAHYLMRLADQHSIKLETFHSQLVTLLEPLKQMQEIDLVLFCNDHCKTMLMYKVT